MGISVCSCVSKSEDTSEFSTENAMIAVTDPQDQSDKIGWIEQNGNKMYRNTDGTLVKSTFKQIEGSTYYFDSDGNMKTDWIQVGNNWYYMGSDGKMQYDWVEVDGVWYYVGKEGKMQTTWHFLLGNWFYLDENTGAMQTGWREISGNWYYFYDNGVLATSWYQIGDDWYYADDTGVMQTGWLTIDGKRYFFDADGKYNQAASEYTLVEPSEFMGYFTDVTITSSNWDSYLSFNSVETTASDGSNVKNYVMDVTGNYTTKFSGSTQNTALVAPSSDFSVTMYFDTTTYVDYVDYGTGNVVSENVNQFAETQSATLTAFGDNALTTVYTGPADSAGFYRYRSYIGSMGVSSSTGELHICSIPDDKWNTEQSTGNRFIAVKNSDSQILKFYEAGTTVRETNGEEDYREYSYTYDSPFGWNRSLVNY